MKIKSIFEYAIILFCLTDWQCNAQMVHTDEPGDEKPVSRYAGCSPADDSLFYIKVKSIAKSPDLVTGTLQTAKSWLGFPYVHGTLDKSDTESLVINFRQLDCWTYVETSLAIALASRDSVPSMARYAYLLQQLRYLNGKIDGYGSRIHYFSEWLLNAESQGYIKDMTKEMGGVLNNKTISYMTDKEKYFPKLIDPEQRIKVEEAQKRISDHEWYFIPKAKVAAMEDQIQDGDIIIITSSRSDLDVEHQGFAVRGADGHIHLMHASSTGKKVIIGMRTLPAYLNRLPVMSGIIVARLSH